MKRLQEFNTVIITFSCSNSRQAHNTKLFPMTSLCQLTHKRFNDRAKFELEHNDHDPSN